MTGRRVAPPSPADLELAALIAQLPRRQRTLLREIVVALLEG